MKFLVVSHSCATPINQQLYAEIERQTDWQITLVVPECWHDEFGNRLFAVRWHEFEGALVPKPVFFNGNIVFHGYRMDWVKFLKSNQFDIIYVNHEPYATATVQVAWANKRSIKAPFGFYSCQNILKTYPPPFSWMERMVYRESAFAFPITEAVSEVIRQKNFRGSMTVCPLPLDPALYHPRHNGNRPARLNSCTLGETLIGYVGRIVEEKGLATLASALGLLADLAWKMVIIGTGAFEAEFEAKLRHAGVHDRIIKLGYVPHNETPDYLATLDILVLPSETRKNWKEQFGRVLLEALACGTPVIGSDSGEIPTLIQQSGGGMTFPERDPVALASALRHLITNPQARQYGAMMGRRWVLDNVSVEAVAKKMIATLQETIAPLSAR